MPRYEFTMVGDPMLRGLRDAGATANEIIAYQMLVRSLPKDRSTTECWMPADMAEAKVGMSPRMFSKALKALTGKRFTTVAGRPVTVLTQTSRGCKGHCPHFEDNLGRLIRDGLYPPADGARNGDPERHPMEGPNGSPKQDPLEEFSTSEWVTKTNQLGTQNEPNGSPSRHPIETRQDKHLVGSAPPHAERCAAVSQPDGRDSIPERLRVVTGGSRRAPASALGGRAGALAPTLEEYLAVERKLATEGLDALTDEEREAYHAGHPLYAAMA